MYMCFSKALRKKKKQFLNCLKPLLIPYSKRLETGRKNREERMKNMTKKNRERRKSREQKGEWKRKPDVQVT